MLAPMGTVTPPWTGDTHLLADAVAAMSDAVTVTDADLDAPGPRIVHVNPAFCRMTGYRAEEVLGRSPRLLQGPATDREVLARLRRDLLATGAFTGRVVNYRRDGEAFMMEWSIGTVRDADGRPRFYVAVQRDATTYAAALADAERARDLDELTGLPGRRAIDEHLAQAAGHAGTLSVLVVDLDRFQDLNARLGEASGDAALREVAGSLRAELRPVDWVGRLGGDAFVVVAPELDEERSRVLAERLRLGVEDLSGRTGPGRVALTVSVGGATGPALTADALLARARDACARAKAAGRNRCAWS
jgi:diguanylate cyclase (GGDEF)-like protein/PAS domain S-box-containing protein